MLLDTACGWQQMNINNVSLLHSVGFVSLIFSLKMSSLITYMSCQFYAIKYLIQSVMSIIVAMHVYFGIPLVIVKTHFGMLNMVMSK